jgi:hypothetical protein
MLNRFPPQQKCVLVLPISRYYIADHLGIAVETVSRSVTALCKAGYISLGTPRCITILDIRGLANGCRRKSTFPHGQAMGTDEVRLRLQ